MPARVRSFQALFALLPLLATGGVDASPLFADDETVELSVSGPFNELFALEDDTQQRPFTVTAEGIKHSVGIRVRGKSRQRVCYFPPLRLTFSAADTAGSLFAGQETIKLVTHCSKGDRGADALHGEYAAYRILSQMTDVAYRVRLASISYIDTSQRRPLNTVTQPGFFIEPAAEFAARTDASVVDVAGVTLGSLDPAHTALVFVFQYLIGNTDWSLVLADGDSSCCHNSDLFDIGDRRYLVPYDFDLAGLVNAPYAKPDPRLRISRVTQRLYRGYCIPDLPLAGALAGFRENKADVIGTVASMPYRSDKQRVKKISFIEDFFDRADKPGKLLRSFRKSCL